jgi:muramidase (phage lysozyme)
MTLSQDGLRAYLSDKNVLALLAVIAAKESGGSYNIINGGARFDDFSRHPYHGIPTTQGGRAAGKYQFLGTTWSRLADRFGFETFGPENQELGAIALIQGRGALADAVAGRFDSAVEKLRNEWTSLPGASESRGDWTMDKARALYLERGGLLDNSELIQPAAPIEDHSPTNLPPVQPKESSMPIPLIVGVIGSLLSQLIPVVAPLFDKKTETPAKLDAATKVIDLLVKATGSVNEQEAIQKLQADPALVQTVTQAIITNPTIMPMLEISTAGIAEARKADVAQQAAATPFWKTSAVFYISLILLPLIYWYVGSSVVGGVEIPADWPWYAQLPLKLFGVTWDPGARVGLANLVVGLVLGGICGVYFGVSVTQTKQQQPAKEQA